MHESRNIGHCTYSVRDHVRNLSAQLYQQTSQMQAIFSHHLQQLAHNRTRTPSLPGSVDVNQHFLIFHRNDSAGWLKTWMYKHMFYTLSNSGIFSFWALWVCEKNAYALSGRIISNCPRHLQACQNYDTGTDYRALSNRASACRLMRNMTFGCLMPIIRPHSDRSSEISHPASSYWASWWILFVLGCTIIRFTRVLFPPPSRRRAQWEGVNGALLSHILQVSARIPTTPLPSKVSLLWEWKNNQHN
jgi:hypothetical protein